MIAWVFVNFDLAFLQNSFGCSNQTSNNRSILTRSPTISGTHKVCQESSLLVSWCKEMFYLGLQVEWRSKPPIRDPMNIFESISQHCQLSSFCCQKSFCDYCQMHISCKLIWMDTKLLLPPVKSSNDFRNIVNDTHCHNNMIAGILLQVSQ